MELVINQNNLARMVSLAERATAKNTTLPILGNILLQAEKGRVTISATNLEIGIVASAGARVTHEGRIAVPARLFTNTIHAVTAPTLTLKTEGNTLTVNAENYQTTLLCFDASEYPIIPKLQQGEMITVPALLLSEALRAVSDSIATSDARPELAGAYLKYSPQQITLAATDSFRLAERTIPLHTNGDGAVILPRAAVTELLRVLTDDTTTIRIVDNQIAVSCDDFEVVSRLIDGRYPDYHKVIPERFVSKALVEKREFEDAVKAAALFASSISDIRIACTGKNVVVSAKNSGRGEGKISLAATMKGEPFEVALNYHYILDGLKIIPTEQVVMEYTGKGGPIVLRPTDSAIPLVYLIMPLRG